MVMLQFSMHFANGLEKVGVFMDCILNKESYLRILKDNLKESEDKLGILETFKTSSKSPA